MPLIIEPNKICKLRKVKQIFFQLLEVQGCPKATVRKFENEGRLSMIADCQWWQIVNGGNALVPDCYADVVAGYHH